MKNFHRDVKLLDLPKIEDHRGNLSFLEGGEHIPFQIERTYWIYDVPGGMARGGHAFIQQKEFIVALSGSFDVLVDDGLNKKVFTLNRSYSGLYIPQGFWREMRNFSTNAVAIVLSSTKFSEKDYIHEYSEFLKLIS